MDEELLQIRRKINSNNQYKNWMKKIEIIENEFATSSEFNNLITLDHGINHMERVANNVYKLLKEYNCNYKVCKLGYIAGLIHDIGMINGKKGHADQGAKMSKVFLEKLELVSASDIKVITNAIKDHGSAKNSSDPITLILAICDKVDMCKKRALGNLSPIKFIEDYTLYMENSTLKIEYKMSSLKGKEGLYIIPKSIDIPILLCARLGIKVKFYINGKYEKFEDRKDYKGKIYQRKD